MSNFVNIIYGLSNSGYSHRLAELVASHCINGKSVVYFVLDQNLDTAIKCVQKALQSSHLFNPGTPYPLIIKQLPPKTATTDDLHNFCNEYGYNPDILAIDYATPLKLDSYDKDSVLQQLYKFANRHNYEIISYIPLGRMASV